jgi:hypothetical protein
MALRAHTWTSRHLASTLERFPVEIGSLAVYEEDPHYPDVKSYLVLGNFF